MSVTVTVSIEPISGTTFGRGLDLRGNVGTRLNYNVARLRVRTRGVHSVNASRAGEREGVRAANDALSVAASALNRAGEGQFAFRLHPLTGYIQVSQTVAASATERYYQILGGAMRDVAIAYRNAYGRAFIRVYFREILLAHVRELRRLFGRFARLRIEI